MLTERYEIALFVAVIAAGYIFLAMMAYALAVAA